MKNAGAGRGYLNPQRTDESDAEYVTPAKHYEMRKQQLEDEDVKANTKAYNKAIGMKSGGTASSRADGCATKGKTKGTIIAMCGGGMYKRK
jgi:hypothetical protein